MSLRLLEHPAALCNVVRRIALEAGEILLLHFDESGVASEAKADGSPVTTADREAEDLIIQRLREALPDIPVVAEEDVARNGLPDLSDSDYFWLVDALDGTREFIAGEPDFTVNIALVFENAPVLGVVYAPFHGELYAGYGPETALRWLEDSGQDKSISVRPMPAKGLTLVMSKHHNDPLRIELFLKTQMVARIIHRASSLKICAVAAGKADLYPRFGTTGWWDTAAGDAVLRSAGGAIIDLADGMPLRYGIGGDPTNPDAIASSGLEWIYLAQQTA